MNEENPLMLWARRALIGAGLFLAGAVLAFGYSYRPLHGALSWQIDQLESRLDERNRENFELSDALAKQKSNDTERIDPNTLTQVERELEQTKRMLNKVEKNLKRTDRKRKDSIANAAKWQKRFEELRGASGSVAATTTTPRTPAAAPASPSADPNPGPVSSAGESQPTPKNGILSADETSSSTAP